MLTNFSLSFQTDLSSLGICLTTLWATPFTQGYSAINAFLHLDCKKWRQGGGRGNSTTNPIVIPVPISHLPFADPFRKTTLIKAVNDGASGSGMTRAITMAVAFHRPVEQSYLLQSTIYRFSPEDGPYSPCKPRRKSWRRATSEWEKNENRFHAQIDLVFIALAI